jgi:pimeloyl-ACP methyl ester carboxylesterase
MRYDASWRSLFVPESGDTPAPGPRGWDHDSRCAELARLAYYRHESGGKARLDAALVALGLAPATAFTDSRSGTQAFAALDADGTAWIAWRGTHVTSLTDVMVDLAAWRLRWAGKARVHAGFRWAYRRLAGEIAAWLAANPHRRLVTTGHSLGGALATLFAAERPEAELVTFGSPRVGNRAFAALMAGRGRRYSAGCDGVAAVPWEWLGYRHIGIEQYIDRTGRVLSPPPDPALRRSDCCAARRESWRDTSLARGELPLRSFTDHAPINYVSALLGIRHDGASPPQ